MLSKYLLFETHPLIAVFIDVLLYRFDDKSVDMVLFCVGWGWTAVGIIPGWSPRIWLLLDVSTHSEYHICGGPFVHLAPSLPTWYFTLFSLLVMVVILTSGIIIYFIPFVFFTWLMFGLVCSWATSFCSIFSFMYCISSLCISSWLLSGFNFALVHVIIYSNNTSVESQIPKAKTHAKLKGL